MTPQHDPLKFPFWAYLKQPLLNPQYRVKLNPRAFARAYRLEHLERCWLKVFKPEEHYNP